MSGWYKIGGSITIDETLLHWTMQVDKDPGSFTLVLGLNDYGVYDIIESTTDRPFAMINFTLLKSDAQRILLPRFLQIEYKS